MMNETEKCDFCSKAKITEKKAHINLSLENLDP